LGKLSDTLNSSLQPPNPNFLLHRLEFLISGYQFRFSIFGQGCSIGIGEADAVAGFEIGGPEFEPCDNRCSGSRFLGYDFSVSPDVYRSAVLAGNLAGILGRPP